MKTWGKDIQGDKMATTKAPREGTSLVCLIPERPVSPEKEPGRHW